MSGSVGKLSLCSVALGTGGHVLVAGDVSKALSVGGLSGRRGGAFVVGHNVTPGR